MEETTFRSEDERKGKISGPGRKKKQDKPSQNSRTDVLYTLVEIYTEERT